MDQVVDRLRAAGCVFAEDEAALLRGAADDPTVLQREVAGLEVHAADLDPVPLTWAVRHLGEGSVHRGDLYDALPGRLHGRVDVVVANAPYVPTGEIALMPPEARDHEPPVPHDGGPEGVDLHRRIAQEAGPWLSVHGVVVIETSAPQAELTSRALQHAGLATTDVSDPDRGAVAVVGRT